MDVLIMNQNWVDNMILSQTPLEIISNLCFKMGATVHIGAMPKKDVEELLVIFEPIVCVSRATLSDFMNETVESALKIGETIAATYFPKGAAAERKNAPLSSGMFSSFYMPPEESFLPKDAESTYLCEGFLRERVCHALLTNGVFISDINTAYISPLAQIEPGACILPNCQIYGDSIIATGVKVGPNTLVSSSIIGENAVVNSSQIYDSRVGSGAKIGPFAHVRPHSSIGENVKLGNFVEIKKSTLGAGAKVSHLSYIGDATIGERVNFGCGSITVNYDGKNKHQTMVGADSFIGCNSNLVAPVSVGEGAFVAAGSTITDCVPENALAIGRAPQSNKADWAKKRRDDGKL